MRSDLPNVAGLHIRSGKIVDYLLDPTHPRGGSKALFLMRFGFTAAQPQSLADAIAGHFRTAPLIRTMIDEAGATRLICEGSLQGLDGRETFVRTVWVIENDDYARLLTLVPLPRRRPTQPA